MDASAAPAGEHADFGPCVARLDGDELTLGTGEIERRWRVANGLLIPTSFRDLASGREWLRPADQPAPTPETLPPDEPRQLTFRARSGQIGPTEAPSLLVELSATGPTQRLEYRFQLFPGARGVLIRLSSGAGGVDAPAVQETAAPTGVEGSGPPAGRSEAPAADVQEWLELACAHPWLAQVILRDQTDAHNELVFENEWLLHPNEAGVQLQGNLFFVEDNLTGEGLIFVKHAPLPHARPVPCPADLSARGRGPLLRFLGHGAGPEGGDGYPFALLAYRGGSAGRIAALQGYQRCLRAYDPERDGLFLSNTWGDRSRDACINDAFLRQEIEAGARLGVDVIQIDDGWQQGRTSNSATPGGVWEGYWAANAGFWEPHPERFPQGLAPVVALARERGMQFGLWFSPDSSNDFANWERDAATLLHLHRTLGIRYFKMDGVKLRGKAGERNLERLFSRVLEESAGRVVFDLDVTAESRPGYLALPGIGPLFVENRYTDWHGYWPHQTLRNLWKLAHYVDPLRLRMEFLNNARNTEKYAGDPLAPACYSPAYLFATTLFANPLGWFELSHLPPAYFEQVAPLAAGWRAHRERLFAGTIYPIGEPPDGTAWTGFLSAAGDGGYLLLFRELNDRPRWSADLPMVPTGAFAVELLGGEGTARIVDGRLEAEIPRAQGFFFGRVERQDP